MTLLRINAEPSGLVLNGGTDKPDQATIQSLSPEGPVIVMMHGFGYRPGDARHCPHDSIFSTDPAKAGLAWPHHLGFGPARPAPGTAIAFGWNARVAKLRTARDRARCAGQQLAGLLARIKRTAPLRPIHLIGHSMGSEVAFSALRHLPAHSVQRLICLTGASYRSTALCAMNGPAGRTAELLNVTSRENDLFDLFYEWGVRPDQRGDRAMGHGLSGRNIVTLQLDHPDHLDALRRLGTPIAPPQRRICHWSAYTRPGVMRLWSRCLLEPAQTPLRLLAPTPPAPRWSRLMPRQSFLPWIPKPAT